MFSPLHEFFVYFLLDFCKFCFRCISINVVLRKSDKIRFVFKNFVVDIHAMVRLGDGWVVVNALEETKHLVWRVVSVRERDWNISAIK